MLAMLKEQKTCRYVQNKGNVFLRNREPESGDSVFNSAYDNLQVASVLHYNSDLWMLDHRITGEDPGGCIEGMCTYQKSMYKQTS